MSPTGTMQTNKNMLVLVLLSMSISIGLAEDTNNVRHVFLSGLLDTTRPDGGFAFVRDCRVEPARALAIRCGTSTNGVSVLKTDDTSRRALLAVDGETNWVRMARYDELYRQKTNMVSASARLKSVVVPEVEFRDAAISDVVESIANSWFCIGHPWVHPTQEIKDDIVTYRFHVDAYDPDDPKSSIALPRGTNGTALVRLGPMVTFRAERITVYDLLTQIVRKAHGTLVISGDEVTVKMRKAETAPGRKPSKAADGLF